MTVAVALVAELVEIVLDVTEMALTDELRETLPNGRFVFGIRKSVDTLEATEPIVLDGLGVSVRFAPVDVAVVPVERDPQTRRRAAIFQRRREIGHVVQGIWKLRRIWLVDRLLILPPI